MKHRARPIPALIGSLFLSLTCAAAQADSGGAAGSAPLQFAGTLDPLSVSVPRLDLLGTAATASEGVVDDQELQLTPAYRPGQLLETVPGLSVTLHSGEGKANQFLMRGYNLDHGTDLETYVDGMPINQPTHAHGQGYTDLNFVIPELADEITYTKGPYYANVGDFGAVGSVRLGYRDTLHDAISATVGSYGFARTLLGGTENLGEGRLLGALEVQHYDGPFATPDNARKENGVLRYSQGDDHDGYSLTGMIYHQIWTNTTDIPERALAEGLVSSPYGSLDPSDGGHALRASVSFNAHQPVGSGQLNVSTYFIYNQLHIFNDFTHFLIDPVHGDQEDQFENRHVLGGTVDYSQRVSWGGLQSTVAGGLLTRFDQLSVGRLPSEGQQSLSPAFDPPSFSNLDSVNILAGAAWLQATTHWTASVRTVLGLREDYQRAADTDLLGAFHETAGYSNAGTVGQSLLQPKGSLIWQASDHYEYYFSAGKGFHSADIRGVNQDKSIDLGLPNTPLLAFQIGEELGMRAAPSRDFTYTLAAYNLYQQSETIINPDVGQDVAGPPSARYGIELNVTWQLARWLELYGSFSGNHTRFTQPFDDGTGHLGEFITDAPRTAGSLALYLTHLGPWSGGLTFRYLGDYPLSSGPCNNAAVAHDFAGRTLTCATAPTAPGQVSAKGYGQLNLDVHYAFDSGWNATFAIYNLLDSHASAAEFWYVDRLQSEIAAYPAGRADIHEHPIEPLMVRVTLARSFGD